MVVPVSMNEQQLGLRLLELPSDLAEQIESTPATLWLKSSETTQQGQSSENAVLCTASKSYQVRQLQSSNVLYILQQTAESGYTAIAQCKGMLELVPSQGDVVAHLRQRVPTHAPGMRERAVTREDLLEHAPFSEGELSNGLKQLCIFEEEGGLWIPARTELLKTWKSLLVAATINGVRLDRLWQTSSLEAQIEDDGMNIELYRALVKHLNTSQSSSEAILDSTQTTAWIGSLVLETNTEAIRETNFVAQWQDLLPEAWRDVAKMELLKNKYSVSAENIISTSVESTRSSNSKKTAYKSKWHDKFRSQT